jgi:hypothetical protein
MCCLRTLIKKETPATDHCCFHSFPNQQPTTIQPTIHLARALLSSSLHRLVVMPLLVIQDKAKEDLGYLQNVSPQGIVVYPVLTCCYWWY